MFDNNRIDNVFADLYYSKFLEKLHEVLKGWCPRVNPFGMKIKIYFYVFKACVPNLMEFLFLQVTLLQAAYLKKCYGIANS